MLLAKKLNILVLCTGNSARSIMAEALFNYDDIRAAFAKCFKDLQSRIDNFVQEVKTQV